MIKVNHISTQVIGGFNYPFALAWNFMKELKPLIQHFPSRMYSVFVSFQLLKTLDSLHKCSSKLIFSFEKPCKWNGLLLNHKNCDLRQLGVSERKAKVFFNEWKEFSIKMPAKMSKFLFNWSCDSLTSLTTEKISDVSTGKSLVIHGNFLVNSLIHIEKSKGPKVNHCGTPASAGSQLYVYMYDN